MTDALTQRARRFTPPTAGSRLARPYTSVPPMSFPEPPDSDSAAPAKLVCNLRTPRPASDDCLPHAAMGLGSVRAVGTSPRPTLVHRLVLQRQMSAWCLFRMDDAGGFVGETWHPDRADGIRTACREFGLSPEEFVEQP